MPPSDQAPILIVDDDASQRTLLETFLHQSGYRTRTAASGQDALRLFDETAPALIISDVRMPGMSGLELQKELRRRQIATPLLLVTAFADIRDAVHAMKEGAVDYLEKPIDLEELRHQIAALLKQNLPATESPLPPLPDNIVAGSPAMRQVLRDTALVAASESRVLITGESGTGKEIVANLIHQWGPRREKTLIKVNCAAIPENLLESELFGHEKGAFTGASATRTGWFEQADGGTILLDEIGEMSAALQAKLLRITQDGSFFKVGGKCEQHVNVRILAATNRDLEKEVAAGLFREDLFFRLNVFEIYLPPLRDRKADIMPLASQAAREFGLEKPRFSPSAATGLENYFWPGNVRELRNAIERAVLLCHGGVILPEYLPRRVLGENAAEPSPETGGGNGGKMEDVERNAILNCLREHHGNRSETARALGISRRKLTYKLQAYREFGFVIDEPEN